MQGRCLEIRESMRIFMPIPVKFCYPARNAMTDTHLSDKAFADLDLPESLLAGVREHRAEYPHSPLARSAEPSTAEILQAARTGDPLARVVLDEAADWLAKIFICCGVILNPALIVVGGGLGLAAADLLMERAEREFRRNVQPDISNNVRIVQSQITVSAVGAACLVWDALY